MSPVTIPRQCSHLNEVDENLPELVELISEEVRFSVASRTLALPSADTEEIVTILRILTLL